ncbi:DUF4256 domain-containing protein [Gramella sp. KN1008]|uniref:DUF4256 domain-containing protein n=1 Tax=Gramella sp. KN1008 TaxID=2529298 RepID=UPI00103A9E58|nr:DUF4256 domain-containing protein [Gramella sp. KN1008]TBW30019.1 DUF4256 domain-containing protein [Gramella sp. KN1008]
MPGKKELSAQQAAEFIELLKARFEKYRERHLGISWPEVQTKLQENTDKLWSLNEMEKTGGEPDVLGHDEDTDEFIFYDCAPESPKGRRSTCYDREAWEARKQHRPKYNAVDMATEMGIELLTEAQYRELQRLGDFDSKTSSWLKTPSEIRELGGAIFGDFRYNTVFIYHNGAQSYYASRGFRGVLRI